MGFEFSQEDVRRQVGSNTAAAGSLTATTKARVCFRLWAILDAEETEKRGYPAFKEAIYFSPRDVERGKEDGVDRKATEEHFRDYPEAFEQFKAWIRNPQIPVQALPYLSSAVLRLLDAGQIRTVQELAQAPNLTFLDHEGNVSQRVSIDSVPELKEPRELAREWLSKRPVEPLAVLPETETEKLRRELAELTQRLNVQAAPKKRGGRVKGSKNRPKAKPDAQNTQSDS